MKKLVLAATAATMMANVASATVYDKYSDLDNCVSAADSPAEHIVCLENKLTAVAHSLDTQADQYLTEKKAKETAEEALAETQAALAAAQATNTDTAELQEELAKWQDKWQKMKNLKDAWHIKAQDLKAEAQTWKEKFYTTEHHLKNWKHIAGQRLDAMEDMAHQIDEMKKYIRTVFNRYGWMVGFPTPPNL